MELPEKLGDPGKFAITIGIGSHRFKALCDLGASASLLPLSIWSKTSMGPLEPVDMRLYMADGSWTKATGVVDDFPVQIGKFFIPNDFIIVDMPEDPTVPIILGRPFLATAGARIDVKKGLLTFNIGDELVEFRFNHTTNETDNTDTMMLNSANEVPNDPPWSLPGPILKNAESNPDHCTTTDGPTDPPWSVTTHALKENKCKFNAKAITEGPTDPPWSVPTHVPKVFEHVEIRYTHDVSNDPSSSLINPSPSREEGKIYQECSPQAKKKFLHGDGQYHGDDPYLFEQRSDHNHRFKEFYELTEPDEEIRATKALTSSN
jgi:hypothetical protein